MNKHVNFVHASTLEEAEYKLKLSTKVSETGYKHCIKFPIHGTGQGSTNSPMIWCFISCTLFDCHKAEANVMEILTPFGDHRVLLHMVGFVDDSTTVTGGN